MKRLVCWLVTRHAVRDQLVLRNEKRGAHVVTKACACGHRYTCMPYKLVGPRPR